MSDNVQLPPTGTGTADVVAATDQLAGGEHVQLMGLIPGPANTAATERIGGDAANGLDVDVTRLPALVAGTANIGDVDVLTVPAPLSTTGGGTEATALRVTVASDSTGALTVKQATAANLKVEASNAGTFTVQDSEKVTDNVGFTDGTTKVQPVGFIFDEVAGTALTENDAAAARIDSKRAQVLVIEDATTRGQRASVSAGGAVKVDASTVAVPVTDNAGSLTVDGTVTASNTAGDIAHDGVNSGNPVQIGVEAIAHGTNPTAVASADRTKLYANRAGIQFVIGGHPNVVTQRTTFTAAQTNATLTGTVNAGTKHVVTAIQVTLDNASTVFPSVLIGFGATTTPTTTQVLAAHGGVPAGGGFSRGDGSGILGIGADGEEVRITTVGVATGNGVEVVVTYYAIES